jgi:exopolysaccharide biosynthesis polyprenyl glycosylphosphotransferase
VPQRHRRDAVRRRLLAACDVAAGVVGTAWIVAAAGDSSSVAAALALPVWIVAAKALGLYDRDERALRHLTVDEIPRIALWAGASAGAAAAVVSVSTRTVGVDAIAIAAVAAGVASVLLRSSTRALFRACTRPERAIVVGDGRFAARIRRKIDLFPDMHLQNVASAPRAAAALVTPNLLAAVDRVIFAVDELHHEHFAAALRDCRRAGVKATIVLPLPDDIGAAADLDRLAELPLVHFGTRDPSPSTLFLKRSLDVVVAGAGLLLLPPLFALIAFAIVVDSRGRVFYGQTRAGLRGRPFRMLKFRTMVADAESRLDDLLSLDDLDEPVFKLPDDPRVTRVGRILRRTSLDELPQLINVLRGDMSLVGPRPEQVELVDRYGPEELIRLAVKPGLTGPMQVLGRGKLTFEERVAVEREYIENLSLARDLRIIALTIPAVLGGDGAF